MIKMGATGEDGRNIACFGLSYANLERLKGGEPIVVELEQLGGSGTVYIFAGATERMMYDELRNLGIVTDDTPTEVDPRLRS
ncbi:MAG: hypothetical protein KAJ19_28925 [Gammaproteobacteria bacterium]|nr:hypothetical protein [Gammaproteobacteria bacterium]